MSRYWQCVEQLQRKLRERSETWDVPLACPTTGFYDVQTHAALAIWTKSVQTTENYRRSCVGFDMDWESWWAGEEQPGCAEQPRVDWVAALARDGMAGIVPVLQDLGFNDAAMLCLQQAWAEWRKEQGGGPPRWSATGIVVLSAAGLLLLGGVAYALWKASQRKRLARGGGVPWVR